MSPGLADSRRALRWRLIRLARWLGLGRLSEWTRLAWQRRSRSHVDLGGVRLGVGAHLSPVIQRAIYGGYYEAPELSCLQRALKSSDVVLELGTGLGLLAAFCARRVGSAPVFTFEANPTLRPLIEETFRLNGVAPTLETVMLGPGSGRRAFYVERDFWRSSTVRGSRPVQEVDVPVWAFNGELERRRPTALIIDIEGGEAELIEYMRLDGVRTVIIELHPRFIGVERTAAVKAFFAAAGFTTAASEGKGMVLWLERGGVSPEGSG
jgi:FkbM family methyltransferase